MPYPGLLHPEPLPLQKSTADLYLHRRQTLTGRSASVSVGSPGVHKGLVEPSKHLWQVWGLILNVILPLQPSCWGFSFALDVGYSLPPKMEKLYTMRKNKTGS